MEKTVIEEQYQTIASKFFGSIFGALICLLIRTLTIGSKTTRQNVRNFPCAV